MELDKQFQRPLQRQVREMVLIDRIKADVRLNSKEIDNGIEIRDISGKEINEKEDNLVRIAWR